VTFGISLNYGPNLDIYNGQILGFEIDGKRHLMVLSSFWTSTLVGANPAVLLKYSKKSENLILRVFIMRI
jgi:hypothetical protein